MFPVTEIMVGETLLSVWTADEAAERQQGLRNVAELPSDVDGMVFLYSTPSNATYVADDTLIPLDIWWFDADGSLMYSDQMGPCEQAVCGEFVSPGPVSAVLETPLGRYAFPPGSTLSTVESD